MDNSQYSLFPQKQPEQAVTLCQRMVAELTVDDCRADLRMFERDLRRAWLVRNRTAGWFGGRWIDQGQEFVSEWGQNVLSTSSGSGRNGATD